MKKVFIVLSLLMVCLAVSAQVGRYTRSAAPRVQQNARIPQTRTTTRSIPGAGSELYNTARGVNANNYSTQARRPVPTATRTTKDAIEEKVSAKMWKQIAASGRKAFSSETDAMRAVQNNRQNYVSSGNDVKCANCGGSGYQTFDNAYIECGACRGVGYHKEYSAEKKAQIREHREELHAQYEASKEKARQDRKDLANQKAYSQKADIVRSMKNLPEHYYNDDLRKEVQDDMKNLRKKSTPGKVQYNELEDWLRKKVNE